MSAESVSETTADRRRWIVLALLVAAQFMVVLDVAIVNVNELPYVFIEELKRRKIRMIDLPPDDNAFSLNCLAIAPGRVIMHTQRTPRLADALDRHGITVLPIDYECVELGGGGIHCSTAPLARDPI